MSLPKHIASNLTETLQDLGLSELEIKVFLFLLQYQGSQRVSTIARQTRINRTTLYGLLHSLAERGLVTSVEDHGVLTYSSIEPSSLVEHIERLREKLSRHAKKMTSTVSYIEKVRAQTIGSFPAIQFFDGKEGIKQAYEDTIKNNPSKEVVGFVGTQAVYEAMDLEWVRSYLERRTKAGLKWRSIATNSPQSFSLRERDPKESRKTKILPPGYEFEIEFVTYENKVLIASFSQVHPLALVIEDEQIARTVRELFRYIDNTISNE
jgi:sugar-specific transcriptional regulator TrmB